MNELKNLIQIVRKYFRNVCNYVRLDGLLHILCVAILALSLFAFIPYLPSIIIAAAVAIAKELIYDVWLKKRVAEWHDIICDLAGLIYASIVFLISLL